MNSIDPFQITVTLVSTTELHTDNHSRGSMRHKLHAGCKAVDFKVKADVRAVTALSALQTRGGGD